MEQHFSFRRVRHSTQPTGSEILRDEATFQTCGYGRDTRLQFTGLLAPTLAMFVAERLRANMMLDGDIATVRS